MWGREWVVTGHAGLYLLDISTDRSVRGLQPVSRHRFASRPLAYGAAGPDEIDRAYDNAGFFVVYARRRAKSSQQGRDKTAAAETDQLCKGTHVGHRPKRVGSPCV